MSKYRITIRRFEEDDDETNPGIVWKDFYEQTLYAEEATIKEAIRVINAPDQKSKDTK